MLVHAAGALCRPLAANFPCYSLLIPLGGKRGVCLEGYLALICGEWPCLGVCCRARARLCSFFLCVAIPKMVGCGAERSGVCAGPCAASCERLVSSLHGLQCDAHPEDIEVQAELGRCAVGLWCLLRVFLLHV